VTETAPPVSAIMPTHNGAAFVGETIESILGQTYERLELVVVDDASSDGTPEVVASYAERNPGRIVLVRGDEQLGPCRRRNDAIDRSSGELIAWIDQDDLWLPDKTECQVELLRKRPEVGLVYSGYEAFDSETGKTIPWRDRSSEAEGDVLVPLFVQGCFVASLTALFRREVLTRRSMRLRETDFSFGDDHYLWLALSLDWQVARIDDVLARYRRHVGNESSRLAGTNFHEKRLALLREFLQAFPEAGARLGAWRRRGLAEQQLKSAAYERRAGHRGGSAAAVGRALGSAPLYTLRSLMRP
jgi:glycosyltransferase involved in cell wall biosynthesis